MSLNKSRKQNHLCGIRIDPPPEITSKIMVLTEWPGNLLNRTFYLIKSYFHQAATIFFGPASAEKALKGILTYNRVKFEKTHDLEILGTEVLKLYPDLNELLFNANGLTPYAVEFRYIQAMFQVMTKGSRILYE